MKRLTTAETNRLIAEGKLPAYLMPKNPERADELEDIADERELTPPEEAELRELWKEAAASPEFRERRCQLLRRFGECEKEG